MITGRELDTEIHRSSDATALSARISDANCAIKALKREHAGNYINSNFTKEEDGSDGTMFPATIQSTNPA